MIIINGDLLTSDAKYIAHQTNCVSRGSAAGIARVIFNKYPHSDCYVGRIKNDIPGTIDVRGNDNQRYVINMMGQYYPGSYYHSENDNQLARQEYFLNCLYHISKIENIESIAFPARIGCGIAGGDWDIYLNMIEDFEKNINLTQEVKVYIFDIGT